MFMAWLPSPTNHILEPQDPTISQCFYNIPYMEVKALSADIASLNFMSKISEKEVNACLCCEELRLKLHKAKLQISSYEE